jgi:hypothetical protein
VELLPRERGNEEDPVTDKITERLVHRPSGPAASETVAVDPPAPPPRARTSVEDALAELAGVERDLVGGPKLSSAMRHSAGSGTLERGDAGEPPPEPLPEWSEAIPHGPGDCGGCGRPLPPGDDDQCPQCGAGLCRVCFEGLEPPPCPSCAEVRPSRDRPPSRNQR